MALPRFLAFGWLAGLVDCFRASVGRVPSFEPGVPRPHLGSHVCDTAPGPSVTSGSVTSASMMEFTPMTIGARGRMWAGGLIGLFATLTFTAPTPPGPSASLGKGVGVAGPRFLAHELLAGALGCWWVGHYRDCGFIGRLLGVLFRRLSRGF